MSRLQAKSPSRKHIAESLAKLEADTIAGPLRWTDGPVKNVARPPLVGGQWRRPATVVYDLVIVANKQHPQIKTNGHMEAIKYG